jgi:hypothetical protein
MDEALAQLVRCVNHFEVEREAVVGEAARAAQRF